LAVRLNTLPPRSSIAHQSGPVTETLKINRSTIRISPHGGRENVPAPETFGGVTFCAACPTPQKRKDRAKR